MEKNVVLKLAKYTKDYLTAHYQNVDVRLTRSDDRFLELGERANIANRFDADFFLSIHINSGGGTGYEDYVHSNIKPASSTKKALAAIHAEVSKLWTSRTFKDRGMKAANYQVLRDTAMIAVLTESGFIDNAKDAALLKQDKFLHETAKAHAVGIAKAFGLKTK